MLKIYFVCVYQRYTKYTGQLSQYSAKAKAEKS